MPKAMRGAGQRVQCAGTGRSTGGTDAALGRLRVTVIDGTWGSTDKTQLCGCSLWGGLESGWALGMGGETIWGSGWHKESHGHGQVQSMLMDPRNTGRL